MLSILQCLADKKIKSKEDKNGQNGRYIWAKDINVYIIIYHPYNYQFDQSEKHKCSTTKRQRPHTRDQRYVNQTTLRLYTQHTRHAVSFGLKSMISTKSFSKPYPMREHQTLHLSSGLYA